MKSFESLHKQKLKKLHTLHNKVVFERVFAVVKLQSEDIVNIFYRVLLNNTTAIKFLNHGIVKSRLRQTLAQWLNDAFIFRSQPEDLEVYYQYQLEIGHIHARIDLSMGLVNYRMDLIKTQVIMALKNSKLKLDELADALILATHIF